jgi:hypothetical protein
MRIKPAVAGAVIRDPDTRRELPAEGGVVPDTSFWIRRLMAGEVVVVEPPPADLPDTPRIIITPVPSAPAKPEKKG